VAENPLVTIGRILGGVALMHGGLGHQVLGQLLLMNTNEVAIAGASVVVAATSRQKNAVAQAAIRTAAPALAARLLIQRQQDRLEREAKLLEKRELRLEERALAVGKRESDLEARRKADEAAGAARAAAGDDEKRRLQRRLDRVSARLRSLKESSGTPRRRPRKRKR
jgi:hypothetical protein